MALITYADKSTMNANASVPAVNKCQASDMNEIKTVVNTNYNEVQPYVTDTGWQDLTIGTSVSTNDQKPQYRVIGKVVYVRANITTGVPSGSRTIATGIPSQYRPAVNRVFWGISGGGNRINRSYIDTNGNLVIQWVLNISDGSTATGSTWHDLYTSYVIN